jgi:hypothetical protein
MAGLDTLRKTETAQKRKRELHVHHVGVSARVAHLRLYAPRDIAHFHRQGSICHILKKFPVRVT